MSKHFRQVGVWLNLWLGFVASAEEILKFNLIERKLPNGLTVLMVEDHTVPVISYQTWVRVGSVDETHGIRGMAHLFEHMMFKGTKKYGPKSFFTQLELKGAEVNAFTTRDYTVFYQNFSPALLETVIDLESDRFSQMTFTEAELKTEVQVVFEERRLRTENSPEGRMSEVLWAMAYQQHPYRWPVVGFVGDLLAVKVSDVEKFFEIFYRPSNMAVVVVGAIQPEKTFEWIQTHYGKIPKRDPPPRNVPKEPRQETELRRVIQDDVSSDLLAHAYHITSAHDDESYALDVLANILFQGSSSRVYRKLIEEKNLALDVSGSAYTPSFPGLFIITASAKNLHSAEEIEKVVDGVIAEVKSGGVTQEEVNIAVRQLVVQVLDGIRTPYGLGQLIGTVQMILGNPKRYQEDVKKYRKVTPSDVKAVAKKYLDISGRTVVITRAKARANRGGGG